MVSCLVQGNYLQADETPVDVQMHDGQGKNHKAFLWQYGRPGGGTVFDFRLGRDRAGPQQFLENFHGILQTDAYQDLYPAVVIIGALPQDLFVDDFHLVDCRGRSGLCGTELRDRVEFLE